MDEARRIRKNGSHLTEGYYGYGYIYPKRSIGSLSNRKKSFNFRVGVSTCNIPSLRDAVKLQAGPVLQCRLCIKFHGCGTYSRTTTSEQAAVYVSLGIHVFFSTKFVTP